MELNLNFVFIKFNQILLILISSISILLINNIIILNRHKQIVLLPEPVLPNIPNFSFGKISKYKFLKTISMLFRNLIFPSEFQLINFLLFPKLKYFSDSNLYYNIFP